MTKFIRCVKMFSKIRTSVFLRRLNMIEINSAVQTLIKSMDETLKQCNMSVVLPQGTKKGEAPITTDGNKSIITFSSDTGAVKIELFEGKLTLFCANEKSSKATEGDYTQVSVSLFEIEDNTFEIKDVKSVANEINDSVLKFFGYAKGSAVGKQAKTAVKKGGKNSTVTYEPENLAVRIANIYPELKEQLDNNIQKYELFLAEEFFNEHANKLIIESMKTGNEARIKKLFNIFNIFYEDGPKDTQSLIAVTILGINLKDDKETYDRVEGYMEKDLKSAVSHVIKYLSTFKGKKATKSLENPKPYVSKRIKK